MSREAHIHCARVYLREARSRSRNPKQRSFCFVLLQWAANARLRAIAETLKPAQPAQGDLFGV